MTPQARPTDATSDDGGQARRGRWIVACSWLTVLVGWSLLVDTGVVQHRALAGPIAVLQTLVHDAYADHLLRDLAATFARVLAGVGLGLAVGSALGIVLGSTPAVRSQVEPQLDFLRAIPPLLVFTLLLLALGYGETARVLAVAFAATLVVSLHVGAAVARTPIDRLRTLHALHASGWQRVRWLYAFQAWPACLTGCRHAVSQGLVVAVVTEMMVGAQAGLGTRAVSAQIAYDAPRLYGVLLVTGALGHAASRWIGAAESRLAARWH